MSEETIAKSVPWLARLIQDELIPLLQQLVERLPEKKKAAPSPFAQPELPGMHATPPATAAFPITVTKEPPQTQIDSNDIVTDANGELLGVVAVDDSAELPNGLCWTNPETPVPPPTPRAWSNTVKVFNLIYARFAAGDFRLGELAGNAEFVAEVRKATANRIGIASFSRILSTLVRAGAVKRQARDLYCIPVPPSDLIRARIEDATRKGNLHNKPKEKVA